MWVQRTLGCLSCLGLSWRARHEPRHPVHDVLIGRTALQAALPIIGMLAPSNIASIATTPRISHHQSPGAAEDPQYIVELVFFDTADDANRYRTFMREQVWSSSTPGLASNPHAIILNEVDGIES